MQPGAEILVPFFNALFSQFGAVVALLMLMVAYLVRELKEERKAHDETTGKLVLSAEQNARTGVELAEALRGLKSIVERLAERLEPRARHDR